MSSTRVPIHGTAGRMVPRATMVIVVAFTLIGFRPTDTSAAEIRLNSECLCEAAVVTLGDVATIHALDQETVDKLTSLELFPAPAPGGRRFVSVRKIQDMLFRRGVNLAEHDISGSSQVAVLGATPATENERRDAPSAALVKRANARLAQAVARYLRETVSASKPWIVDVKLDEHQVRLTTGPRSSMSVRGGMAPWLGLQRFEITIDSGSESSAFQIDADVSLPPDVVITVRALPRGRVISAADVRLQPVSTSDTSSDRFYQTQDVIGLETTTAVGAGRPLIRKTVRQPLLIRRGDVVTVFARAAGISVRVMARARDDGSLGDAVSVESMLDRTVYLARVSGLREAEVFAQPVRTKPAAASPRSAGKSAAWTTSLGGKTL
jgi:flagellar basal body P-ring formation protein FlgA